MDIGGQAVVEGVMLRSPKAVTTAVRLPDGRIKVRKKTEKALKERYPILGKPFIRGVITMYEMLKIGMDALIWSGNQAEEEDMSDLSIYLTVGVSFVFAFGLFLLLPYFLTTIMGISEDNNAVAFNLVDGLIKIAILVAYIYIISLMKDVRTMFQYHGAEHMVVHAYENKKSLTPASVKKFSTIHPRCGTSFIFVVFFVMVLLFSFIPNLIDLIFPAAANMGFWPRRVLMFGARFLFLVPVIGVSYEVLKLSDKHQHNPILGFISYPGRLIQGLTTKRPSTKQIEVAIAAIKPLLK